MLFSKFGMVFSGMGCRGGVSGTLPDGSTLAALAGRARESVRKIKAEVKIRMLVAAPCNLLVTGS